MIKDIMNTNNNFELLVDMIDAQSSTSANATTADQAGLAGDNGHEYAMLQSVVAGIRDAGLNEQVARIRKQYEASMHHSAEPAKVIHMNFRKTVLRVAAAILLIFISASTYKYLAVSDKGIYDEYYSSYQLNTTRSTATTDEMEKTYRAGQWQQVVDAASATQLTSNKELFLAAMANMELKNFNAAIPSFEKILQKNAQTGEDYFVDEAEYYLAMSYLATGQTKPALPLLRSINQDKEHVFHSRVRKMNLDLKILNLKN